MGQKKLRIYILIAIDIIYGLFSHSMYFEYSTYITILHTNAKNLTIETNNKVPEFPYSQFTFIEIYI